MQFTIQNRPAADFATLAANRDAQILADDFDGDGNTDLALINQGGGWTSVPIALASPTSFTIENISAPDFAGLAANPSVEAVSGDFNGDGKADIALINRGAGWTSVPIALSGTAGFTVENLSAPDFAALAASPDVEAVSGDFNGDGTADIALINHALGWNTVPIALVSSTGVTIQNRPAADFAALAASPDVTVIADDFNNDGKADLALINQAAGWTSVPVALSDLTSFTISNVSAPDLASLAANASVSIVAGDFNGDGVADFGLVNQAPGWNTVPIGITAV
ncbi:MAG TPA: VCBS repeat-containing protein [Rhodopila sp.]|nr:VCBS repeat-containing protein [Rhodopila sp.]